MRRFVSLALSMLTLLCLSSCTGKEKSAELSEKIAEKYSGAALHAVMEITADYGERVYIFKADYSGDSQEGKITLLEPESIAGITAYVSGEGSKLSFDGAELDTGALTSGGLSPVELLPELIRSWSKEEASACSHEKIGDAECVRFETEFGESAGQITWFDENTMLPLRSEILSAGRSVLICSFEAVETAG